MSSAWTWARAARAPACSIWPAACSASAKHDITLFQRAARSSSSRAARSGAPSAVSVKRRAGAGGGVARADRRHRLRRDLLARRAGRGRAALAGRARPSRAERDIIVWMDHRAVEQAERINAAGHEVLKLRRRQDLAGDGDAEAAVAAREPAGRLRGGLAVLRPDRLPDLARDRRSVAIDLHGHLQVDLSRARAALGRELFPQRRPRRAGGRGLRAHRPAASSSRARRSATG